MQLIRAINKSNRSNNNNQTSSGSHNKVVIIAPPPARSTSAYQQKNGSSEQSATPVSPSVALPALKKRTSIVKQSVPPPVPPRGSPRSKSNLFGVSCRNRIQPKSTIDVDRLKSLSSFEQSGCQKVKEWLETVEIMPFKESSEISIPEQPEINNVKQLVETFSRKDDKVMKNSFAKGHKVFDSSLVKSRVESYNSLEREVKPRKLYLRSSDGGTDSGIDIPARDSALHIDNRRRFLYQFSRDGEFV